MPYGLSWLAAAVCPPAATAFAAPPPPAGRPLATQALAAAGGTTAAALVGYVTDVEGKLALFQDYAARSLVVMLEVGPDGHERLQWRKPSDPVGSPDASPDLHFVYGGDVFDKGDGDLRLARLLVDFKIRYPQHVHLILGNRDANKLKLVAHLTGPELSQSVHTLPGPYWWSGLSSYVTPAQFMASRALPDSRSARLRYHLHCTMGAAAMFEARKAELALLAGRSSPDDVSDDEVVDSFLAAADPRHPASQETVVVPREGHVCVRPHDIVASGGGEALKYVVLSELAALVHDSLFVHGGVSRRALGFVPADDAFDGVTRAAVGTTLPPSASIHEWVAALRAWQLRALAAFVASPGYLDLDRNQRGGAQLFSYFYTRAVHGRSVAIHPSLTRGVPNEPPADVALALRDSGIARVVSGHKPFSDSPTLVRANGVEYILGDMSFSDTNAPDNRGAAVAEVVIVHPRDGLPSFPFLHGRLACGLEYAFAAKQPDNPDAPDPGAWLGKRTRTGWIPVVILPSGWLVLDRGRGRVVEHLLVDPAGVERMMVA
ncbi:uncharacterized protein AMSG_04897 [Thecamonas trahens ATCC 50062]|uniref:Calcineurin-like phosphoesterase domain-containing protein n=1 Tax=Thecamonas trahens ATCC 50062 TaxID=461836 RepID=A0A0L0D8P0_THETB|nr:hypothetical protein AMSG_04897 [Thecamonas trahens ATCC 50062]KNC48451.1 hypothetical protein AMSG_04897 [Thecamonas trahens ATCC 50062]|eukprot:XP_013758564.1 hypothetical protein AMSG_04897 [Thecamonas trahens ATCC 50062]